MKKSVLFFFLLVFISSIAFAQDAGMADQSSYKRQQAIGISFVLNDYLTAQRIRSRSLGYVIGHKQRAKFNEMSPGLGITYFKGLQNHVDFAGTFSGSFVDDALPNKPSSSSGFLGEADASVNLKMFTDEYIFTPYLSVGVGASKYRSYYGAFLPLGGGLKLNLFDEAAIFVNAQYRVPVTTETSTYHFFYNIGISGIIGKKQ